MSSDVRDSTSAPTTAAEAMLRERFERFLKIAGTAPSDPAHRDELRRRVLMQLDCEDAASCRAVLRLAARVDETLAEYPPAAVMADWDVPWPSSEPRCGGRRAARAADVR